MPEGDLPIDAAEIPETTPEASNDAEAAADVADAPDDAAADAADPSHMLLPRIGWAISTKPGQFAPPAQLPKRLSRGIPRRFGRRRGAAFLAVCLIAAISITAGSFVIVRGTSGAAAASPVAATRDAGISDVIAAGAAPTPRTTPTPPGVSASSSIAATSGTVFFSDKFDNQASGWVTDATSSLKHTTFQYGSTGYTIGSLGGTMHHLVYAPYAAAKTQLSMSVTATQRGAPLGAGFGVSCRRGTDAGQVVYEFIVVSSGRFLVDRWIGTPTVDGEAAPLQRGEVPYPPGLVPTTVTGVCATLADGSATRLALFVDGQLLVDFTDRMPVSGTGWTGGIVMSSLEAPSTMTATYFEERDLTK